MTYIEISVITWGFADTVMMLLGVFAIIGFGQPLLF